MYKYPKSCEEVNQYYSDNQFNIVQQTKQLTISKMKIFIVLAVFAATASASLVASPVVGYNSYGLSGLNAGYPLLSGGVRTLSPIGASYVSPIATRVVSPISSGLVSPYGYGGQYVSGVSQFQPYGTRLVSPVATRLVSSPLVRTVSPVHLSPLATRVVAPISAYNTPIVSNVVGPSLYSTHGSGLYASGYLGKKL